MYEAFQAKISESEEHKFYKFFKSWCWVEALLQISTKDTLELAIDGNPETTRSVRKSTRPAPGFRPLGTFSGPHRVDDFENSK